MQNFRTRPDNGKQYVQLSDARCRNIAIFCSVLNFAAIIFCVAVNGCWMSCVLSANSDLKSLTWRNKASGISFVSNVRKLNQKSKKLSQQISVAMSQGATRRLSAFLDSHVGKILLEFFSVQVVPLKVAQVKTRRKFAKSSTKPDEIQFHCSLRTCRNFWELKTWLWPPPSLLASFGPLRFLFVCEKETAATRALFPGCFRNSGASWKLHALHAIPNVCRGRNVKPVIKLRTGLLWRANNDHYLRSGTFGYVLVILKAHLLKKEMVCFKEISQRIWEQLYERRHICPSLWPSGTAQISPDSFSWNFVFRTWTKVGRHLPTLFGIGRK
jgi:hypothetical protein